MRVKDEVFDNPMEYFQGTYVFDEHVFPELNGLTGYAFQHESDRGDFGEGPSKTYSVFFSEFPDRRFIGYEYPERDGEVEKTGTFYPWQETLF